MTWENKPPDGEYVVKVENYKINKVKENGYSDYSDVDFKLYVTINGETKTFNGKTKGTRNKTKYVAFEISNDAK